MLPAGALAEGESYTYVDNYLTILTNFGFGDANGSVPLGEVTALTIGKDVTKIQETGQPYSMLRVLTALQTMTVEQGNTAFTVNDNALFMNEGKKLAYYPQQDRAVYHVPEAVDTIGNAAFANVSNIKAVVFPAGLHTMFFDVFPQYQSCTLYFLGNTPPTLNYYSIPQGRRYDI